MREVRLGSGGPVVSAIGYGGASIGGSYGQVDAEQARAVLRNAFELGITFFDTADVYGNGVSETLIGKVLNTWRSQCRIASKVGMVRSADRVTTTVNGRPAHVIASCDASLARLGMEMMDLYYLHRVDPDVPVEETVGAMARLVEVGKVRTLGLCEASADTLRRAHATHPLTAYQMEYSLLCRDCEKEILPLCQELGIGFVAYCPLGRGFLTGKVADLNLEQGSRARDPRFNETNIQHNLSLLPPLQEIASGHGCTPGQAALAWVIGKGAVPIPGTTNIGHMRENLEASAVSFSESDIQHLDSLFAPGAASGARGSPEALARIGH